MTDRTVMDAPDEVEVLLKSERRRQNRERFGVMVLVAGLLAGGAILTFAEIAGLSDVAASFWLMVAAGVGVLGALMVLAWKRGRAARRLESLIGRRDRLQRSRNDRIYATSITGWGMVALSLPPLWRIVQGQADGSDLGLVIAATLAPWLVVTSVSGWDGLARLNRRWLEDEVTRDIRGRALSLGFMVLMLAMTGLFVLSLWERNWATMAFPAALMSAASAAGLRFVWLDQQAEGGERG
jgi:hypothetical protein